MRTLYQTKRRTGRTTGLMLDAISRAILNPNTSVFFQDHDVCDNKSVNKNLFDRLSLIITTLRLGINIKQHTNPYRIELTSCLPMTLIDPKSCEFFILDQSELYE